MGRFFQFLKTTPGYICCIFIPFALLILIQGINCIRLFKKYKQEQYSEIKAERDKLEEERAESQKMMNELLELKKQLQNGTDDAAAAGNSTAEQTVASPAPENTETTVSEPAVSEAANVAEGTDGSDTSDVE